jgi:hypothetical protein
VRRRCGHWAGSIVEAQAGANQALTVTLLPSGIVPRAERVKAALATARVAAGTGTAEVARVTGLVRDGQGSHGLATVRIDGEPLATVLDGRPMAPARAVAIVRQLCRILARTHAIGVLHGAITADAVWLCSTGGRRDRVHLSDFGLSNLLDGTALPDDGRRPISPEQVMGTDRGPEEDVYLLGCLAYRLLTGEEPLTGATPDERRRRHAIEDPKRIARAAGEGAVAAPIAAVIEQCLGKLPQDRFEDTSALEAALCRAQMAAGLRTPWDDLPLPELPASERAAIERFFATPLRAPEPAPARPASPPPPPAPAPPPVATARPVEIQVEPEPAPVPEAQTATQAPIEASTPRLEPASRRSRWPWVSGIAAVLAITVVLAITGRDDAPSPPTAPPPKTPAPAPVARPEPAPAPAPAPEPEPEPEPEPAPEPEPEPSEPQPAPVEPGPEPTIAPDGGPDGASGPARPRSPERAAELAREGRSAQKAGRASAALALYLQALEHDAENRAALVGAADIYFNRSDHRRAAGYLRRAVAQAPSNPEYRISLGDAYYKLGRYGDARKQYEKAKALGSPLADRRIEKVAGKAG